MFSSKAKIAFFCIVGLVILLHWSEAGEYDDESESNEKHYDVGRLERSDEDLVNEDPSSSQVTVRIKRRYARRRKLVYARRRRMPPQHSRRRRWGRWG